MATVHIVEEDPVQREAIEGFLEKKLPGVNIRTWKYIWRLVRAADSELRPGDIAVCDLFVPGYFGLTRSLSPRVKQIEHPTRTGPLSTENIRRATLDYIGNFIERLIERGAKVIVYTHVPEYMRHRAKPPRPEVSDEVIDRLVAASLDRERDIIEKIQREEANTQELARIAARVATLLDLTNTPPRNDN